MRRGGVGTTLRSLYILRHLPSAIFLGSSNLCIDSLCIYQSPDARIVSFAIEICDEFAKAYIYEEGLRYMRFRVVLVVVVQVKSSSPEKLEMCR